MAGDNRKKASAVESVSDRLAHVAVSPTDGLKDTFLRFSKEGCGGYAGLWRFFSAAGANDEHENSSFRCVRTYEYLDDDPPQVQFRTFHENQPGTSTTSRKLDGLFESGYKRPASNPFFSPIMALSAEERSAERPDFTFWRCAAVDAQNVVRIAPALPPKPLEQVVDRMAAYPGWGARDIAQGVFAFESFIEHGKQRWSLGALFSVHNLQLLSHFVIQEHSTSVDPEKPICFNELPFQESRPRLDAATETWLESGTWKGEMQEVVWDEDGEAMKMASRPATWQAPNPKSTSHRLYLYPDAMYAYYPNKLPTVVDQENTFSTGARFEMGGLMRESLEFRRLVLRYSSNGQVTSLTKEVYRPEDDTDFEFLRRNSTSVRRSVDSRQRRSEARRSFDDNRKTGQAEGRATRLETAMRRAQSQAPAVVPAVLR